MTSSSFEALGSVRCFFAHNVVIHGAVDEWNFSSVQLNQDVLLKSIVCLC